VRVLILEDEAPARARLEAALGRVAPAAEVAAAHASVAHALAWFASHPAPDLVLADIQLADGLSFEVFAGGITCPAVFCTAYDEYVIEAMTAGGIDYLLKPIKDDALARALARYDRLAAHFADRVRAVASRLASPRRILARRRDGFVAVGVDEIAYFVVDDKQADVVTRDGRRYGVDQTLGELEASLDPARFFRVNRQYLVAAAAIGGFRPFVKGKLLVDLAPAVDGDVIVSQENATRFRTWLRG
jgi:DNA-binding LytR/AlgR family response regulator